MISGLHRFPIPFSAKKRDSEFLADRVAASLVIKVAVGKDMRGELLTSEKTQEAPVTQSSSGIDKDAPRQIDVHHVRLKQWNPRNPIAYRKGIHSNPQPGNPAI